MRSRRIAIALAFLAGAAVVAPALATPSEAAWTGDQWTYAPAVSTAAMNCGTDTGYASTASGQFLSGSLLGTDLSTVAGVQGMTLSMGSSGTATPTPSVANGATEVTSAPPTYENPLNVTALGSIGVLNTSAINAGVPVGQVGATNQWAQTSATGEAAGAAGLVDNSGGVDVTPSASASAEPPASATIDLGSLLPTVANEVTDVKAVVGAVGANSTVNGCDVLKSALWGNGSATASRSYGIASLGLEAGAPPLGTLTTQVNNTVGSLTSAVSGLVGSNGSIANGVLGLAQNSLGSSLLGLLGVQLTSASVSISNLNLQAALGTLLTAPLSDGVVTINLSTGTVYADLAALTGHAGGLNGLAANTELALNATVVNNLVSRVTTLLTTWNMSVTQALTTAINAATVSLNVGLGVDVLSTGLNVANATVSLNATVGQIVGGTVPASAMSVSVTGVVGSTVSLALSLLGINLNTITSDLTSGLTNGLVSTVANLLSPLLKQVTTLGSTLSGITGPVVTALGTTLAPLPTVLALMVNVEPDQACPAPGSATDSAEAATCAALASSYTKAAARSTAQYLETALRIGVGSAAVSGGLGLSLATASAGPVTLPPS